MYRYPLTLLKSVKSKIAGWGTANLFPWLKYRKWEGAGSRGRRFLRWYYLVLAMFALIALCPPVQQGLVSFFLKSYTLSEVALHPTAPPVAPGQPSTLTVPNVVGSTTVPDSGQNPVEANAPAPATPEPAPDLYQMRSPLKGRIIAGFGQFIYYDTFKEYRMHQGMDWAAPEGAAIIAALNGQVTGVGSNREWGGWVEVDHGGGWLTRYAHLAAVEVTRGQMVQAGEILGRLGSSGTYEAGSETHLHFELQHEHQPCDPLVYFGVQ